MVSIFIIVLIVEIAAIALKLTGLDIHTARFQALSAITGTGFTSRETESLMKHRQRRRVIMVLMVLGSICFLGMFSSFLISMRQEFHVVHLFLLLFLIGFLLLMVRNRRFVALFHRHVENQLKRYKYPHKPLSETDFKDKGFIVLAIERAGEILGVPRASDVILPGGILVIFGRRRGLKALVGHEK